MIRSPRTGNIVNTLPTGTHHLPGKFTIYILAISMAFGGLFTLRPRYADAEVTGTVESAWDFQAGEYSQTTGLNRLTIGFDNSLGNLGYRIHAGGVYGVQTDYSRKFLGEYDSDIRYRLSRNFHLSIFSTREINSPFIYLQNDTRNIQNKHGVRLFYTPGRRFNMDLQIGQRTFRNSNTTYFATHLHTLYKTLHFRLEGQQSLESGSNQNINYWMFSINGNLTSEIQVTSRNFVNFFDLQPYYNLYQQIYYHPFERLEFRFKTQQYYGKRSKELFATQNTSLISQYRLLDEVYWQNEYFEETVDQFHETRGTRYFSTGFSWNMNRDPGAFYIRNFIYLKGGFSQSSYYGDGGMFAGDIDLRAQYSHRGFQISLNLTSQNMIFRGSRKPAHQFNHRIELHTSQSTGPFSYLENRLEISSNSGDAIRYRPDTLNIYLRDYIDYTIRRKLLSITAGPDLTRDIENNTTRIGFHSFIHWYSRKRLQIQTRLYWDTPGNRPDIHETSSRTQTNIHYQLGKFKLTLFYIYDKRLDNPQIIQIKVLRFI